MVTPVAPIVHDIYVNGSKITDIITDVELRQGFSQHDMAFVRIEHQPPHNTDSQKRSWPQNGNISMNWGRGSGNISQWQGYVNHSETLSHSESGNNTLQMTHVLIGTSKPMNADTSKEWNNASYTYIASQIAAKHGHTPITIGNPIVNKHYEVQANESDFEYLNRTAQKIGYKLWASNHKLYYVDPAMQLKQNGGSKAIQYSMDKKPAVYDTLARFQTIAGDNVPGYTQSTKQVFGVDNNNNVIGSTAGKSSGGLNVINSTRYVGTQAEADQMSQGMQALEQHWSHSEALVFGATGLQPGAVMGLSGQALPGEHHGDWLVASVSHNLRKPYPSVPVIEKYASRVHLMRPTAA